MSTVYYTKLWLRAREDLEKILQMDLKIQSGRPLADMEMAATLCLDLYYRYRNIIRRITECHDQLIQPQVRDVIGKILDFTIIRMLEIRKEIVDLTFSECSWPTSLLIDMKLTPDDITPKAPLYDLGTRMVEMERRQRIIQDALDQTALMEELMEDTTSYAEMSTSGFTGMYSQSHVTTMTRRTEETAVTSVYDTMSVQAEKKTWHDAMVLLQKHERARIGRRIAIIAEKRKIKINKMIEEGLDPAAEEEILGPEHDQAASVIQRAWRTCVDRRRDKDKRIKMDEACFMTQPGYRDRRVFDKYKEVLKDSLEQQRKAAEDCKKKFQDVKNKLEIRRAPVILDEIKEEIREWMMHWYEVADVFDYIPPAEFGGTQLIVTGKTRTPEEFESQRNKDDKKPEKPPNKEEAPVEELWSLPQSKNFEDLMNANQIYVDEWIMRTDQISDPENPLIVEAMVDEICYHLQLQMRVFADEQMRPEHEKLNKALILDKVEEGYFAPEPEDYAELMQDDDEKEQKEKPKKKEEPKPNEVDPLEGVPEDELLVELAMSNVLREIPEEELEDWPGAPAYSFGVLNETRLGDIKHPVIDYCVLPLGSKLVNELAPFSRSICICGPPRSGPVFLARAVCNELKATVFDLTPQRHVGRFANRASQDRLATVVVKLARSYAPSIILVENEAAWLKNMPLSLRKAKPAKFLNVYKQIVKEINPGDRVLFLTASCEPYLADGSFLKSFDRILVVPEADYGSLVRAWKSRMNREHHVDRYFDVSCLAKLMAGSVPLGQAEDILEASLTMSRKMTFKSKPLTQSELLERFIGRSKDIQQSLKLWNKLRYSRIPMEKQRKRHEQELREAAEAESKAKKK